MHSRRELTILNRRVELGDPHVTSDNRDVLGIRFAVFEPLVHLATSGDPRPALAVNWTCENDARTWIFQLRRGVTFHDGTPFHALDVVTSLQRVTEQDLGGEMASHGVYQSYLAGARFAVLGDEIVRITTAEPTADLLDILATIMIVPRNFVADSGHSIIGTGPYRVLEAMDGALTMESFAKYWGETSPVDILHWQAEPQADRRVFRLLHGEADLISGLGVIERQTILASGRASVVDAETSLCVAFLCNLRSGPCRDRRVRQALNYGLDIDEIVHEVLAGAARRLNGPLTPLHFGHAPELAPYPYDPDRARTLLRDAGFPQGVEIVVDVPSSLPDEAPELARQMAEQYARIGITVSVRRFDDRLAYAEMVRAKHIDDACCFDSSPQSTFRVFREKLHGRIQGPWWQGYANSTVDGLVDRAAMTPDPMQRQGLYRQAYRLIYADAPWIFLYSPLTCYGCGPKLRGWQPGVNGVIQFV